MNFNSGMRLSINFYKMREAQRTTSMRQGLTTLPAHTNYCSRATLQRHGQGVFHTA
jgi:hypothetical protein